MIDRADQLREAREAAGLTLHDVAQRLRLSPRHLQAIEAADWERLPGTAFSRAALRSYARLLSVEVDGLLAQLPSANSPDLLRPAPSLEARLPRRGDGLGFRSGSGSGMRRVFWGAAALLAVLAGSALLIWPDAIQGLRESVRARQEHAAPATAAPPSVVADQNAALSLPIAEPGGNPSGVGDTPATRSSSASSAAEAALPSAAAIPGGPSVSETASPTLSGAISWPQSLVISSRRESWVEVRDQGDRVLHMGLVRPSMPLTLQLKGPATYTVGNSASTVLEFAGRSVNLAAQTQPGTTIAKGSLP